MSTVSDYTLSNIGFSAFRSELNTILAAINTLNATTSAPASKVAGSLWLDTTSATTPTLKFYDGSDWISLCTFNYSGNTVNWLDNTVTADLSGDSSPQLGGDLDVNGQDIVSTSNADIDIIPNGTGDVNLGADTVQVGDNNADATITTQGTGDLTLNTNNGSSSGNITVADGANGDITISPDGTGEAKAVDAGDNTSAIKIAGKESIWIPSNAITPTESNGCASITATETQANRPDMYTLDFDASSDEHAQFTVAFPKSWNASTVTFQVFWTSTATDTDGIAWGLQGVACANDGTIDAAYGSPVVVTDDNISAAEDCLVTAESSAITIAGSPGDDELCFFRIFRDVSDGNDDMTEDAQLLGIKLFYTTDAANDA